MYPQPIQTPTPSIAPPTTGMRNTKSEFAANGDKTWLCSCGPLEAKFAPESTANVVVAR